MTVKYTHDKLIFSPLRGLPETYWPEGYSSEE